MKGSWRASHLLFAGAAAAALTVAPGPAALATSCAVDPLATPAALTDGTYSGRGEDFFDRYDYALVGTVTGKQTGPGGGRTTVTFDVAGVLGRAAVESEIEVSLSDDGQLNGYRFETGTSYFVPLVDRNANGLTNYSFLCDPIAPVADPDREYARLSALASARGIPAAQPAIPPQAIQARTNDGGNRALVAWSAAGLAVLAAGASLVVAARRRS